VFVRVNHLQELFFVYYFNSEFAGFVQFASGFFASKHKVGFFAHAGGRLSAGLPYRLLNLLAGEIL